MNVQITANEDETFSIEITDLNENTYESFIDLIDEDLAKEKAALIKTSTDGYKTLLTEILEAHKAAIRKYNSRYA